MKAEIYQDVRLESVSRRAPGFTMVEVLVSIGIVASVALSILALLAFAGESAGDLKSSSAARRASGVIRQWVGHSDFNSLYEELRSGRELLLVTYEYQPGEGERPDGTPMPASDREGPGTISAVPAIRRPDDPEIDGDLEAVDGPAFLCRLTLLSLVAESSPELPPVAEYKLAALPLRVELFRIPPIAAVARRGVPQRRPAFSFQTHAFR